MANSPATLSSKLSTPIRHLILRQSPAASSASLTRKLPFDHSAAVFEKPELMSVGELSLLGRADFPAFQLMGQRVVIEAAESRGKKPSVSDDDEEEFDEDDSDEFDDEDEDEDDEFYDDDDDGDRKAKH